MSIRDELRHKARNSRDATEAAPLGDFVRGAFYGQIAPQIVATSLTHWTSQSVVQQ
jgi:hypothetical protein